MLVAGSIAVLSPLFRANSAHAQLPEPEAAAVIAIRGVNVLPMDGERVAENQTVLVRDGVIEEVGAAGSVRVPTGARVIEGAGRYLMPGLAEMHAHVPPVQVGRAPQALLEEYMFLYLANGITTIRGMLGSPYQLDLREELERGDLAGPRFIVGAPSMNGNSAPTPEIGERMMEEAAAMGYDLMKIHPGVSRETWDRAVAVARRVGLPWGGHTPAAVGVEHALRSGMTTVDHLDGYLEAAASPMDPPFGGAPADPQVMVDGIDEARMVELADLTAELGAFAVPTQYLWENLYGARGADEALVQDEMQYVSAAQRNAWRQQAAGLPQLPGATRSAFLDRRDQMLRLLADRGAVLMGTDSPQLFNVPGFALHREIDAMLEAGMTPYQVLQSGTTAVGRYLDEVLGQEIQLGRVAPGYVADLVLLEGNPLDDMAALRERAGVMIRGRWLDGAALEAGLAEIARRHAG
jgi:imidazolonepropionase-like amidohydrolase